MLLPRVDWLQSKPRKRKRRNWLSQRPRENESPNKKIKGLKSVFSQLRTRMIKTMVSL
ncbi:hypothetical protein DPMN_194203 [Dreissena polymorpha]|uniref:Uncharacterized protein n=1 Tax=Dreissena polymorpha TaxID=45954 RepID=A0A9D4BF48_DREPO|nr:hypothetical protein DPMN_194203 [Dreissena polymorpha]